MAPTKIRDWGIVREGRRTTSDRMRMFRLPAWISDSRVREKVVNGKPVYSMAQAYSIPEPVADTPVLKRKREEEFMENGMCNGLSPSLPVAKRSKSSSDGSEPVIKNEPVEDAIRNQEALPASRPSVHRLRDTLESQISLEILVKHDELRLIDQEMAKCQIALEQLRRCHLIPYPTSVPNPMTMQDISNGTGPALAPSPGDIRPAWAAPYGVTDGPYARHYAKWLIPDPAFDGWQGAWSVAVEGSRGGKTVPEGRTTRNSFADGSIPNGKPRSQRASSGQKLQALPTGYPQPKGKAGPCILKRADGQNVKLVCTDCNREDFSSTQGFINHCRIAHKRDYKSHEEAAVACGQPIELDEVGGIVGDEKAPVVATGLVHPLIRSCPTDREAYKALLAHIDTSMNLYNIGKLPGVSSIPGKDQTGTSNSRCLSVKSKASKPSPNFVPSSQTPNLSALLQSRGFDRDLNVLVNEAKKPLDMEIFSSYSEESDHDKPRKGSGSNGVTHTPKPTMRVPARAGMSPAPLGRPGSAKGLESRSPRPAFAMPINTTQAAQNLKPQTQIIKEDVDESPVHDHDEKDHVIIGVGSALDLSPNTVVSNNAPSLVSDDGEYDDNDDGRSFIGSDIGDDHDSVAEIDIEEDAEGHPIRHSDREGNGESSMRLRKEDKHVTFVGPVKGNDKHR